MDTVGALIDKRDAHLLREHNYYPHSEGYLWRRESNKKRTHHFLHHDVIGLPPKGFVVDHKNGNKLDVRRRNLRFIRQSQNTRNRKIHKNNHSGAKGVSWSKATDKWKAQILSNGEYHYLGVFPTIKEAAAAYAAASKKFHGHYGRPK